jgi:hypothetical protein
LYVFGSEAGPIYPGAKHGNHSLYFYPVNTAPEKSKALFIGVVNRANKLAEKLEFYNTLKSTCATNIVRHANATTPERIPFSFKTLAPG